MAPELLQFIALLVAFAGLVRFGGPLTRRVRRDAERRRAVRSPEPERSPPGAARAGRIAPRPTHRKQRNRAGIASDPPTSRPGGRAGDRRPATDHLDRAHRARHKRAPPPRRHAASRGRGRRQRVDRQPRTVGRRAHRCAHINPRASHADVVAPIGRVQRANWAATLGSSHRPNQPCSSSHASIDGRTANRPSAPTPPVPRTTSEVKRRPDRGRQRSVETGSQKEVCK